MATPSTAAGGAPVGQRGSPFSASVATLVETIGELTGPDSSLARRQRVLQLLIRFAANASVPSECLRTEPGRPYGVCCVHDDPTGWSLSAVALEPGRSTPPHDHHSWGAAATVVGVERNVRFTGRCPDQLYPIDTQIFCPGTGYLFDRCDIHQASNASHQLTVSMHLLAAPGPHPTQRCPEPTAERSADELDMEHS